MRVLVTGVAGFIGAACAQALLARGDEVVGIDNFNSYYDPAYKQDRVTTLLGHYDFTLNRADITDFAFIQKLFSANSFDAILHVAAQAGVRYSMENPSAYESSNQLGTLHIFEAARLAGVKKIIYASSSSVYGANTKLPFAETDPVDQPISFYAVTKRSNELLAQLYHRLYGINTVGLRFFTVYGPWGRPDMAYFSFAKKIFHHETIQVFNTGQMERDFTYIDDIVAGTLKALDSDLKCEIMNLGNQRPVPLLYFIEQLEKALGVSAKKEFLPLQPGDPIKTFADTRKAKELLGWEPTTAIETGLQKFAAWYKSYHSIT